MSPRDIIHQWIPSPRTLFTSKYCPSLVNNVPPWEHTRKPSRRWNGYVVDSSMEFLAGALVNSEFCPPRTLFTSEFCLPRHYSLANVVSFSSWSLNCSAQDIVIAGLLCLPIAYWTSTKSTIIVNCYTCDSTEQHYSYPQCNILRCYIYVP